MIDTNVVVDLLEGTGTWFGWSRDRLAEARSNGSVAVSVIVVAELSTGTMPAEILLAALDDLKIEVLDFDRSAGFRAGQAQRAYRVSGGTRKRLLGDFLIGAHAETRRADLLTRDVRYYRRYFPDLTLITPETDA